MSEFDDLRVAMRAMLTKRFRWFKARSVAEQEDLVTAVSAMVRATRAQIADAAAEVKRAEERRALTEPCWRPCFACGRLAQRVHGAFFDADAVFDAWIGHYNLASDIDGEEVRENLREHAIRVHAKDGAHALCALIDAVRDARLDDEYPAFDVPLAQDMPSMELE